MSKSKLFDFPDRIAELDFSVALPADWIVHELPAEAADFDNPTVLQPLALVTAPHAALIFAFAARPAYGDGTLLDWARYLLEQNKLTPSAIGAHEVAGVPAQVGEATQESELGPLLVRFAFLEDGGRLVNITLTAPEMLAGAVQQAWFAALESFALAKPRGATPPASAPATPPAETAPAAAPTGEGFAAHALADTAETLDPEHPVNANLRDRGIGLVPRVLATDTAARQATVAAGAIQALLDLPFGWHVIDDGKRTLLLDPGGAMQISLSLMALEGRDATGLLDAIEAEARESYPAPEFMRLEQDGITALGVRNIADGGTAIEQYHMLVPGLAEGFMLRARVTATPERSTQAVNLAELILRSQRRPAVETEPAGDGPAWWLKAQALDAKDKLEEAEQAILKAVDHLGAAASVAELYRQRMLRLMQAGDREGAQAAFKKADQWIHFYAGQATSGGEGAALSRERDAFLNQLQGEFSR